MNLLSFSKISDKTVISYVLVIDPYNLPFAKIKDPPVT